jgi:PhzF family phenazine biosynthesis protein
VCRALKLGADTLSLEMSAGIIPVVAQGRRWTLTAKGSSWRELELPRERLALLLGLSAADVLERPLWVQSGREQLLVPLASERAVRSASLQGAALDSLGGADNPGVYVFAFASPQRAVARFFFAHGAEFREDPATGSACANLGGWCLAMGRDLPCSVLINQGEMVGRPSLLYLDVDSAATVRVGGDVIELGQGSLHL